MTLNNIFFHLEKYAARDELVSRYSRVLSSGSVDEGGEIHHILPRSLFPEFSKESWNLVRLSHKAHFIAHMLLWKITRTKQMMFAFNSMAYTKGVKKTSRIYSEARKEYRSAVGKMSSERLKIDNPMFRPEVREKLSKKNKGQTLSEARIRILFEGRNKWIRENGHPRKGVVLSEEIRNKISKANIGKNSGELNPFFGNTHSKETRKRMSEKKKGLMPWERNQFKKESVPFYLKADELYEKYSSGLTGIKLCRSVFNNDIFASHTQNIVLWFKKGWIPKECVKWLEWSERHV